MDKNLNFGGKTFKFAMAWTPAAYFTRETAGFNKKYNANVSLVSLGWGTYDTQLATAISAGEPYDLAFMQDAQVAPSNMKNLFTPLQSYFTTVDIANPKNLTAGGINMQMSSAFLWNNNLYAVSNPRVTDVAMWFYNKLMFRDIFGDADYPMTLYKQGKWTWDEFKKLGAQAVDSSNGTYILYLLPGGEWPSYNGAQWITIVNGKPETNFSDKKLIDSLQFMKDVYSGPNAIVSGAVGGSSDDKFMSGNSLMLAKQSSAYGGFPDEVKTSNALGKSMANIGWVPAPMGPDNTTDIYPLNCSQGWAACKGSKDPRVVVAWDKYDSNWVDPVVDPNAYPKAYSDLITTLQSGNVASQYGAGFADGKEVFGGICTSTITGGAASGADFMKLLNDNQQTCQSILDYCMSQQ